MMANEWFRFKKFIVRQEKTAMKVGTDGVLLGAWVEIEDCQKILDVGTGTGLIALMMAQRSSAVIDAVEINPEAAKQAFENCSLSPWWERIHVICTSFQEYHKNSLFRYDLIVCNPPFFSNSLKTGDPKRNLARHDEHLTITELISGSIGLLNPGGRLCTILPAERESEIIDISKFYNLFPSKIQRIRPVPAKVYSRVLICFSFEKMEPSEAELTVETGPRHQYSPEYLQLTRDYYL